MKKKLGLLLILTALLQLQPSIPFPSEPMVAEAGVLDNFASNQIEIFSTELAFTKSAYVFLKETDEMHGMTYISAEGATEGHPNYNKLRTFKGIQGREYLKENILTLHLDKDFADEEDSSFILSIDYYDYGGRGTFAIEYMPQGTNVSTRLTVAKQGDGSGGTIDYQDGKWRRATIVVSDADFNGKLADGSDIKIHTNGWNTFSKVEVFNLSKNMDPTVDLGTFNMGSAMALNKLGVFDGFGDGEVFVPQLSKVLTREEALKLLITCYGLEDEAVSRKLRPTTQKVNENLVCYAGLAEELGVIEPRTDLDLTEHFTQRELLVWYLKLIGVEDDDLWGNAYALAEELSWITAENMIIQPERTANIDALVVFAINAFAATNPKTGYNAFSEGIKEGIYQYQTIMSIGHDALSRWLREEPFNLPSQKHVDPYTGRTYHMVDLFGSEASIPYFSQPCVSTDNKCVYFYSLSRDIYEYNLETEMCRWIAKCDHSLCFMITPLNNLWYVRNNQIRKVNLDTYEDIFVHDGFPGYTGYYQQLQINNDETLLSVEVQDHLVPESVRPRRSNGRYMNLLNLETGEWDHSYFFTHPIPDGNALNHLCINPGVEYKNWYFFAHEGFLKNSYTGSSTPQYDRNWMINLDTREYFNIFDQRWYIQPEKNNPGTGIISTGSSHETFCGSGEWFATVYVANALGGIVVPQSTRASMALMKPDGSNLWLVPTDFSFSRNYYFQNACGNHASLDWDANWVISDTSYNSLQETDFYLTETHTGKSHILARFKHNGQNNGHVHPQFSRDASFVVFGGWSSDFKTVQWGWMDVSDITSNPSEGGRFDVSESCESFAYKGNFEHSIEPSFNKDGSVKEIRIPAGRSMYVDVKDTVVETDNTPATITITYKDDNRMPLKLCYYTWKENSPGDINEFKEREIYIQRKGTGQKVTKTLKLDDICLGNMELLRSDFRIRAAGGKATVYSVEVSVPESY